MLTSAPLRVRESLTFPASDSSGDYSPAAAFEVTMGWWNSTSHAPSSFLSAILCAPFSSACSRMPGEVELGTDESAGRNSHTSNAPFAKPFEG